MADEPGRKKNQKSRSCHGFGENLGEAQARGSQVSSFITDESPCWSFSSARWELGYGVGEEKRKAKQNKQTK